MSLPLIAEIRDAPRPEDLVRGLAGRPWVTWLDTALGGRSWGRYSFLAIDPFRVLRGRAGRAEWIGAQGAEPAGGDALTELGGALKMYGRPPREDLPPFCGGAAGMLGYELSSDLERIPAAAFRDLPTPDLEVGLYDLVVGWDRLEKRCWVASTGSSGSERDSAELADRRLRQARDWLGGGPAPVHHRLSTGSDLGAFITPPPPTYPVPGVAGFRSTFTPAGYRDAVRRAIEWIRAGDVYQVNLSQRFDAVCEEDPVELYRRLRRASPAPFGAFFSGDGFSVLSTSPERFLHVSEEGRVQTRPIKGTRPRGDDRTEDRNLAAELQASVKDRAENLMIVDLLRNDLSRVCTPDSVRASDLFRIESYRTVHHLVSTVEGRLSPGLGATDLLRSTFPSGSVTGAPKIRAMEIIADLEPVARGPYCGALGYLGFGGDMDTSVSIRIAVAIEDRLAVHAGGAVVVDSDPEAEYQETLDKVRALVTSLPLAAR